jgi:hypothetical protein
MLKKVGSIACAAILAVVTMLLISADGSFVINPAPLQITNEIAEVPEVERVDFVNLIAKNPNYFGTIEKTSLQPIVAMSNNIKYEAITNFGLYPEQDTLEAFINVKLPYGYGGNLCTAGSTEYVRFYMDWNNDGDYIDSGEDMGLSNVNVHDVPNETGACLTAPKPLTYAAYLKINPVKYPCDKPRLVRTKAILSWQNPPTAGNPGYVPVWGNSIEKTVQIEPKPMLIIKPDVLIAEDYLLNPYLKEYGTADIQPKPTLLPPDLKKIYVEKPVSELRFAFSELSRKLDDSPDSVKALVSNFPDYVIEKSGIQYERLNTAGLNYDLDELAAQLTIRLPYGYSGDLCSAGSDEYVAFWLYLWDQVEQRCSWRYMGTATVNVHDIPSIPAAGLEYAVKLPANLNSLKDKCENQVVIKMRAILSWGNPPSPNNPDYMPVWGNKVEKTIQLKPNNNGSPVGCVPFISVVGGMAIESISGNSQSVIPSAFGSGYANGPSVYGGANAIESPFGREIAISGHISNPPNNPTEAMKLQYRVQYKKSGSGTWHNLENAFTIWISEWNGASWNMYSKTQIPVAGTYKYEEDTTLPIQKFVEGNVFGHWYSQYATEGDGLYQIQVVAYNPASGITTYSNLISVVVDNTLPEAAISLVAGACSQFYVGDTISGHFKAWDKHIWRYNLETTPYSLTPATSVSATFPALVPPGVTNQLFQYNTGTNSTCGYVIFVHVRDRAILNNYMQGNYNNAKVGFCLLNKAQ